MMNDANFVLGYKVCVLNSNSCLLVSVQVSGAGVKEKNVVPAVFSLAVCGVFTQTAGTHTTPTANTLSGLTLRGPASRCASGTRTCLNGTCPSGVPALSL